MSWIEIDISRRDAFSPVVAELVGDYLDDDEAIIIRPFQPRLNLELITGASFVAMHIFGGTKASFRIRIPDYAGLLVVVGEAFTTDVPTGTTTFRLNVGDGRSLGTEVGMALAPGETTLMTLEANVEAFRGGLVNYAVDAKNSNADIARFVTEDGVASVQTIASRFLPKGSASVAGHTVIVP